MELQDDEGEILGLTVKALESKRKADARNHMVTIARLAIVLRRSLPKGIGGEIIKGIILDSREHHISMRRKIIITDGASCVYGIGCVKQRGSWCATIPGTPSCGGGQGPAPKPWYTR